MREKIRLLSLFSGIGAPEVALRKLGFEVELVGFSEIDKFAVNSYCAIHNVSSEKNLGDITKIEVDKLPKDIDIITHGSPCQSFSVAGKQEGGDEGSGTRSSLMWNTVAIVKETKPKYVLWENVKNVLSKNHKHNFDKYISEMESIGYKNYYKVLNSKNFGVPQSRERIFVISIRNDIEKEFLFPQGFDNGIRLKHILEQEVDEKFYVKNEKAEKLISEYKSSRVVNVEGVAPTVMENHGTVTSVIEEDHNYISKKCKEFYDKNGYFPEIFNAFNLKDCTEEALTLTCTCGDISSRTGMLITEENKGVEINALIGSTQRCCFKGNGDYVPTLPAAMGLGGGHVPMFELKSNYRIRKLTPRECWRLMGFSDSDFDKASSVSSNSQLYKQAGNSIVTNVLYYIFKDLLG